MKLKTFIGLSSKFKDFAFLKLMMAKLVLF